MREEHMSDIIHFKDVLKDMNIQYIGEQTDRVGKCGVWFYDYETQGTMYAELGQTTKQFIKRLKERRLEFKKGGK